MNKLKILPIVLLFFSCEKSQYCASCKTKDNRKVDGVWTLIDTVEVDNCDEKIEVTEWMQSKLSEAVDNDSVRVTVQCQQEKEEE